MNAKQEKTALFPVRREFLKWMSGGAVMTAAGLMVPKAAVAQQACSIKGSPSLTEGPYFVDEELNRVDIRRDPSDGALQAGYPLSLSVNVAQLKNCATVPLSGAYVDIWHCNAQGLYSDQSANGTTGKKYLRGFQATDRYGSAYFLSVYPGWYQGRTVHIHVKVRIFTDGQQSYEFTSQFFFDEALNDEIYLLPEYKRTGARDTRNATDSIYNGSSNTGTITTGSGSYLMLTARKMNGWVEADAKLVCDLSLGSTPDDTPAGGGGAPGSGGPGGGRPPGGGPPPAE